MIVDNAVYVDGHRNASDSIEGTREICREHGGFAWIELHEPTRDEFDSVAEEFGFHRLAARDAFRQHQRSGIERYGETLVVVMKQARYLEDTETVEFGEVAIFVGDGFVITIEHGDAGSLSDVRKSLESEPESLRRGPLAILHAIMDYIVDGYGPVMDGLENDIDEIETEVFGGNSAVSRRIYELFREILQFHRAVQPLVGSLERLSEARDLNPEVRRRLSTIRDRVLRVSEQAASFRELLSNILSVNLTMVSVSQNEQVQKISAWAAILIVPTIITGIYGMNFEYMPELTWPLGYPFALLLMVGISALLYLGFKRSGWL